jgi:outer membrane protein
MSLKRPGPASMSPVSKTIAAALVLAFGAAGAQAQSLSEVVQAARGVDATYLGARASADAARYRYEQARALHLPSANATLVGSRQTSDTPYQPAQTSGATNSLAATINAQQTLFNRANDLQIDQAHKAVDIADSQLVQAEQDLIVRVADAYFKVLAANDALLSVQGNSKAIAEQLASAKRNFEVGNATITDTREAEARADLAHSQEIAAENDLLVAKVALDQLVGRNGVAPHALVLPAVLPPVMPSQASDWLSLAESENPAIKQARLNLEIAELTTAQAKAGHLPTLTVGGQYGRTHTTTSVSTADAQKYGPGGRFSGNGNSGGVNITLTVPLFAGFSIENRVRETVALEEKARTDADGAHNQVVLGTRTAFVTAQTQAAQVKALEAAEASSKLALDATTLGYKVGVKVNLDVLNAQSQLYSTQKDAAGARYNYLMSQLRLRQAAGNLTGNDVLPIDALLVK